MLLGTAGANGLLYVLQTLREHFEFTPGSLRKPIDYLAPIAKNALVGAIMAIDIQSEKLLPITAAAALVPGRHPGKPIAFSTVFRWLLRGAKTPDGRRVKLEGVRLGSKWFTS